MAHANESLGIPDEVQAIENELGSEQINGAQTENPQEQLTDLTARATALYAVKKYDEAAELYSQATELQAEINGEMHEDNADLLFSYGKCLFKVAQKTSTVLGGTAASAQLKNSDKKPSKKRRANGAIKAESSKTPAAPSTSLEAVTETSEPADVIPAEDAQPEESNSKSDKPLFHIEGDAADWDDSEEEEEVEAEDGEGEEEEEEEDDFNTAYEILDLSRVLYLRKIESKSSQPDSESELRTIKTRLADVYDLQAEINLEGEKYDACVSDWRSCLELGLEIYQPDNAYLSECHYKLSLALEQESQVQQRDTDGNPVGEISIDWKIRNAAALHQEKAIESSKLRVAREEKELTAISEDKKAERQKAQEQIDDVKDIIQAMEQRLEELKKPPVSLKAETEKDMAQELMGSVLGQMLGGGAAGKDEQKAKLAEVMAGANDLSGMVKRKKPKPASVEHDDSAVNKEATTATVVNGNGKRKIEHVESETPNGQTETVKKVRIEDVID